MQQIRNKAGEIRVMFWWVDRSYRYLTGYYTLIFSIELGKKELLSDTSYKLD